MSDETEVNDDSGEVGEELSILMRAYFANSHLEAAYHFRDKAQEIEDAHSGLPTYNPIHRGYVVNAVFSAFAFVEASINEVLADAAEVEDSTRLSSLDSAVVGSLAELWRIGGEKFDTLVKYQLALLAAKQPMFDRSRLPYQDVELLKQLRNLVVHAKPETSEIGIEHKLLKKFRNKFPPSKLAHGNTNPYFPDHCLGAGCAAWAVQAALAFADEFYKRIGVATYYSRPNRSGE